LDKRLAAIVGVALSVAAACGLFLVYAMGFEVSAFVNWIQGASMLTQAEAAAIGLGGAGGVIYGYFRSTFRR
jgi:hypothetical protein